MAEIQAEPNYTRLRVNINTETSEAIQELMGPDKETSATEVVRRAIAVYYFFWKLRKKRIRVFYGRSYRKSLHEFVLEL